MNVCGRSGARSSRDANVLVRTCGADDEEPKEWTAQVKPGQRVMRVGEDWGLSVAVHAEWSV